MLLQQRFFGSNYQYEIDDTGLLLKINKGGTYTEAHEPFERIGCNKEIKNSNDKSVLLLSGICISALSITLLCAWFLENDIQIGLIIVLLTISAVLWFFYFRENRKIVLFQSRQQFIEFHANIPSETEVNNFINELIDKRNRYLKEKYTTFRKQLDYQDQFNNLNWLIAIRAISKVEYDEALNQLDKIFNNDSKSIGFANRPD